MVAAAKPQFDPAPFPEIAVRLLIIWALTWAGLLVVKFVARRIIASVDDGDASTMTAAEKRGHTIAHLVQNVGGVGLVAVALLLSINQFVDITAIIAGVGVLGLAVSFGAQSLVKDLIAGFFILLEHQFSVGDVVEVADKAGTVERVTLRVVHLRDADGTLHVIPNGLIGVVSNQTRGWSRAVVDVGVAYEADLDRTLGIFADEAGRMARDPAWARLLDGAPEVQGVTALAESSIVIRTRFRTDAGKQWEVGREFRRRIKARLELEGIDIPFPQRVVRHVYPDGPADAPSHPAAPPSA